MKTPLPDYPRWLLDARAPDLSGTAREHLMYDDLTEEEKALQAERRARYYEALRRRGGYISAGYVKRA